MISVHLKSLSTCKCRANERGFSLQINTLTTHTCTHSHTDYYFQEKDHKWSWGETVWTARWKKGDWSACRRHWRLILHLYWQNKTRGRYQRSFCYLRCCSYCSSVVSWVLSELSLPARLWERSLCLLYKAVLPGEKMVRNSSGVCTTGSFSGQSVGPVRLANQLL